MISGDNATVTNEVEKSRTSLFTKLRVVVGGTITLIIISMWALLMLVIATATLFRARRLYNEYLAKWLATIILWQWGIRMEVHRDYPLSARQTVFISNHTSSLDVFVLVALGLPNCRFFLSGWLRRIIPLGVIGTIMGTFFTVPQTRPAERVKIFQNAEKVLRTTGESVYLSPEGKRVTTGDIGHFNKGSFHLATVLKAPIVPFYVQTPRESDPGMGYDVRSGTVHVYFKPEISTTDWNLEDLVENKEKVRNLFLAYHEELRPA